MPRRLKLPGNRERVREREMSELVICIFILIYTYHNMIGQIPDMTDRMILQEAILLDKAS